MAAPTRRLSSWLYVADHPLWHGKPHYLPALALALTFAYGQIRYARERLDPYFKAFQALAPFSDLLVCDEQRLNLEFALALALAGEDASRQAIIHLARGWEVAERLRDWGAQAKLGYLAGALWHGAGQFTDAYGVYLDAIEALRKLTRDDIPADPAFELDLILRQAWCAYELGWFPVSLRYLDEAYALRATWAPDAADEAASLAWLDAQLARIRGRPHQALSLAASAADLLMGSRPINAGRSQIILAECALDLVELMLAPGGSYVPLAPQARRASGDQYSPAYLLSWARKAAKLGREFAQVSHDSRGTVMADLTLRRATRLRHPSGGESGVGATERLLRTARRLGDPSLLGRAETALAGELMAAGEVEAARVAYYRAMRRLEEYQLGGLAFWPRRALQWLAHSAN